MNPVEPHTKISIVDNESSLTPPEPKVAPAPSPTPPFVPKPKKTRRFFYFVFILFLLALDGTGVYYWQHQKVNLLSTQVKNLEGDLNSNTSKTH